jgi:hypothetical protein
LEGSCPAGWYQSGNECWPTEEYLKYGCVHDIMGSCVDPFQEWKEEQATVAYAKCTVKCVAKQIGIWGIEHLALHQAAKRLAWEFGKRAAPYVGWVTTAITAGETIWCFVECDKPTKCK